MDTSCKAKFESGTYAKTTTDATVRVALVRIDSLDRRLAGDVKAAQAANAALGLVLACLRLQLLVASERLLAMVARDASDPDAVVTARALIIAYKNAITDGSEAVNRVTGFPQAA